MNLTLLEEAKLKYPVGTKFIAPDNDHIYTVSLNESVEDSYYLSIDGDNCLVTINNLRSGQYLYYHGKWAKIISKPCEEIIKNDYTYLIKLFKQLKIK